MRTKTNKSHSRRAVRAAPKNDVRAEFSDGYIEWRGFDEEGGAEEGTAEITAAVIDAAELTASADYEIEGEPVEYLVRLARDADAWSGTFKQLKRGRIEVVGRCNAKEASRDADSRAFHGRWLENGVSYRWTLLLRGAKRRAGN